jgi:uncharacterized membrane protein YeaQ/YmgE (transglycosylase-associated protein family)
LLTSIRAGPVSLAIVNRHLGLATCARMSRSPAGRLEHHHDNAAIRRDDYSGNNSEILYRHYRDVEQVREAKLEALLPIIIQLIAGAVGGNVAGAVAKDVSLGTIGNSIAGAVGGGVGGQILSALIPVLAANIGGQAAGGGIAGIIVTLIAGFIKNRMAQ